MRKRCVNLILMLLAIIITASGFSLSTAKGNNDKITLVDLAGKKVQVKKAVKRIVLIRSRDIYEIAALLGDETPKKIVGWASDIKTKDKDGYKKFLEKYPELGKMPDVGDVQSDSISVEKVVKLKPDLIVMDISMIQSGYKCVDKLIQTGLPCLFIDGSSDPIKSPQKSIEILGKALGKEKRAQDINKFVENQYTSVLRKLKTINKQMPTVYLETGDGGPSKFSSTYGVEKNNKYDSWGAILSNLRVKNIADGVVTGMEAINPEYVLKSNPDIIVITGQNWVTSPGSMRCGYYANLDDSKRILSSFTSRPGWDNLKAVKNKRVYSVFHNFCMHIYGFAGFQALAKDFYPDEFKELNPDKNLKEFYKKFMPIKYSGVWMLGL